LHCDGAGFPAHEILPFIPAKRADHLRQPRGDQFRRIRNGEEAEIEQRILDTNRDSFCKSLELKQITRSRSVTHNMQQAARVSDFTAIPG
jgi:hypothetical protein